MGAVVEVFVSAARVGTTVFTDSRGYYLADNLPVGTYKVKVSTAYFLPSLREDVMLRSGAHLIINLTVNTLADALKMIPARRSDTDGPDDWHWTLRSAANRPILRVLEKDKDSSDSGSLVVVSHKNSESGGDRAVKASVAFIAGGSGGALNGDVEARPVTRERNAEPSRKSLLRYFLAVEPKRQRPESGAGTHSDDSLHDTGPGRFHTAADVPAIERLNSRRRKRVERAPVVMRRPRRDYNSGDALECHRPRVMIRKAPFADRGIPRLRPEISTLAAGDRESDHARRTELHADRSGEPGVADAAGLRRADELRAVGK